MTVGKRLARKRSATAILEHDRVTVHHGDCLDVMAAMREASVDSIITDPPYGLGFMGKEWDHGLPGVPFWEAALRVAKPGAILMAFSGCYDAKTEVLTKRGWITFPDVTMEDEFASLNLKTELVEFQRPTEIVHFEHDGPMHHYHTNRVNLLVTPNHKMLIAPIKRTSDECWHLVPSSDVPATSRMTKTSAGLAHAKNTAFIVPGVRRGKGHGHYEQMPCVLIPAKIWAAFLGLWFAEGHASSSLNRHGGASTHVAITHFNKSNIDEMSKMLRPYFNVRLYPGSGRLRINDPRLYKQFAPLGKAGTKRLPNYVKSWSPTLIRILLDWYARGDGDSEGRIYTASKYLADDVQEIAMYAGLAADISVRPPKDTIIEGHTAKAHYPQYIIRVLTAQMKPEVYARHRKAAVKTIISASEWNSQEVYCVELPKHHTLYVRREGKAVWCGNTRTYHRLACAVEDAGWELRDTMMWLQGQGFPKNTNISKKIDIAAGVKREKKPGGRGPAYQRNIGNTRPWMEEENHMIDSNVPVTEAAKTWHGWGTALKPAYEPILVAMKPLDGTFAHNAVEHGVAGLWIDGGRVGTEERTATDADSIYSQGKNKMEKRKPRQVKGRWPANLILSHDPRCVPVGVTQDPGYQINRFTDGAKPFGDGAGHEYESVEQPGGEREVWACVPGCPVRMLDEQSGQSSGVRRDMKLRRGASRKSSDLGMNKDLASRIADSGGASRFFYTAKASTTERHLGCPPGFQNTHPTVKPLDLCRYLCRLTRTPTGGVVLDPFSGSGSIAVTALLEGRTAIAIDLEEESAQATVARVQAALKWGDKLQSLKKFRMPKRKRLPRKRR